MKTADCSLAVAVSQYLECSGMTATRFGREAAGDPRLVHDLRNGRTPRAKMVERVRAFMAANPTAPLPAHGWPKEREHWFLTMALRGDHQRDIVLKLGCSPREVRERLDRLREQRTGRLRLNTAA